jgi:alpha-beta hydrolase superfamily lysophospholipase
LRNCLCSWQRPNRSRLVFASFAGTNGSGKLLAELLAHEGFVTLRYDKRASGPHVKENISKLIGKISMQSHLDELSGAVETLVSDGHVREDCVFVLTNSEGAIHALNYQLQTKSRRFKRVGAYGCAWKSYWRGWAQSDFGSGGEFAQWRRYHETLR